MRFSIKVNYSSIGYIIHVNSLLTSLFNQSIDSSSTNNKRKSVGRIERTDEIDESHPTKN